MRGQLKIGTRDSALAKIQSAKVQNLLVQKGHTAELVFIKSEGDLNLTTPLYKLGVQGIFTKALDSALLRNEIDLAVHSLKDVPVDTALGTVIAAVLPRESPFDCLVSHSPLPDGASIGTSSIRRMAQWLNKNPQHAVKNIRGNVETRLAKVKQGEYDGVIFAEAGLIRLGMLPADAQRLDWMIPAPAQGAIAVTCRRDDEELIKILNELNNEETYKCTAAERNFLKLLEGGCSAPIGTLAVIQNQKIKFKGTVLSSDGKEKWDVMSEGDEDEFLLVSMQAAEELMKKGVKELK